MRVAFCCLSRKFVRVCVCVSAYTCGFPAGTFFCCLGENRAFRRDRTFFFFAKRHFCKLSIAGGRLPNRNGNFARPSGRFSRSNDNFYRPLGGHFVRRRCFFWQTALLAVFAKRQIHIYNIYLDPPGVHFFCRLLKKQYIVSFAPKRAFSF